MEHREEKDIRCSIVIPVLDSHDVLHRQLKYFEQFLPFNWEVIIMDDGSNPPILENVGDYSYNLRIVPTHDYRPWSQPKARNMGVDLARGKYVLMPAIDHIITKKMIDHIHSEEFIRMNFFRTWGVLEYECQFRIDCDKKLSDCELPVKLCQNLEVLRRYGIDERKISRYDIPFDIYAMPREVFLEIGGYDIDCCGKYGGDDVDFSRRYQDWVNKQVKAKLEGVSDQEERQKVVDFYRNKQRYGMFVYPEPADDVLGLFHKLKR